MCSFGTRFIFTTIACDIEKELSINVLITVWYGYRLTKGFIRDCVHLLYLYAGAINNGKQGVYVRIKIQTTTNGILDCTHLRVTLFLIIGLLPKVSFTDPPPLQGLRPIPYFSISWHPFVSPAGLDVSLLYCLSCTKIGFGFITGTWVVDCVAYCDIN